MATELSQEEVFADDKDPLAAIAEIRREEGVPEEDLPIADAEPVEEPAVAPEPEGEDELNNLEKPEDNPQPAPEEDKTETPAAEDDNIPVADSAEKPEGEQEPAPEGDDPVDNKPEKTTETVRKFKANGQEFEFTDTEINEQFETVFAQAMNYTQKMQAIAPYRKMISALEQENITSEQLNTAIDALKGNPEALKKMLADNKIDAYDLNSNAEGEDTPYTAPEYGRNESQLNIDEITQSISGDPEYQITVDVVDNQWDQNSRTALTANPDMIKGLHNDIKSGMYDKVAPAAMKLKVLDGNKKSDLEYYILAGEKVIAAEQQVTATAEQTVADASKQTQTANQEFDTASSEAQQKRSASNTRTRADKKNIVNYLEDDDEDFDAWYKKLQASN